MNPIFLFFVIVKRPLCFDPLEQPHSKRTQLKTRAIWSILVGVGMSVFILFAEFPVDRSFLAD
jgi:hypothetical protein